MNGHARQIRLVREFRRIKNNHRRAMKYWAAKATLTPSVIRVFSKKSREKILPHLVSINVSKLSGFQSQVQYDRWLMDRLSNLASLVRRLNPNNPTINPGYKWGHAAKVLNIYVREILLHSRYFDPVVVERVSKWLHVPIDGRNIHRLEGARLSASFRSDQTSQEPSGVRQLPVVA